LLFKRFRIQPCRASLVHALQNGELIIIWDVLPISEMFTSLTKLVGKGTFMPLGIEIMANSSAIL
jgi:hypothetical protein